MKKLLTICIATYKRPKKLQYCIDSVVEQIEKYALSDCIDIYVANDASPDDTVSVLNAYVSLNYFITVSREKNLGMSMNYKNMLSDISKKSDYQLIITDDDYLQPDILGEIVGFLQEQQKIANGAPIIWTPRYSYTEDDKLHCIVCNPFNESSFVKPSVVNAAKYMNNGFVLSGLILKSEYIDYEFWEQYRENAFFPMIFFGDLLLKGGAYYWNKNIVHHTVLNECHWDRWGKNDVIIYLRLFSDGVNAYSVMGESIRSSPGKIQFYLFSFRNIKQAIYSLIYSNELKVDMLIVTDAIDELKNSRVIRFNLPLRQLMLWGLFLNVAISVTKLLILNIFLFIDIRKARREKYRHIIGNYLGLFRSLPHVFQIITSK
ncbi:MAG: glycosyltransferase family 2 protein [Spirochaetia bacterium]|nr:glycosyltransferase family 2 protein [Spirochaetia bacterium]